MGGAVSLVTSIFTSAMGKSQKKSDSSKQLAKERAAREAEQRQEEAKDRRRARAKVLEARDLEKKRNRSTLSSGAASLLEDPETTTTGLKDKLGE